MELLLRHQFDTLSAADSGKQHKFSWQQWDAAAKQETFLCHAMYQSGEDDIRTSDSGHAKRGEICRLQFNENGNCAPGHDVELKVDDPAWQAQDYQNVARHILQDGKTENGEALTREQKTAALCQLASLYNLMATQYGVLFLGGIRALPPEPKVRDIKDALDEMVTDRKLHAVSDWFKQLAGDMLAGKTPEVGPLYLPEPSAQEPIPAWSWSHGIEVQPGAKGHLFAFWKRKETLPEPLSYHPLSPNYAYDKVAEAGYMSGQWGERVAVFPMAPSRPLDADISRGLGLHARLGAQALRQPLTKNIVQSLVVPVPVMQNAQVIHNALKKGAATPDQAISALVMLASLYRLVATRYNGEFGYDPGGTPMAPHYFDDPKEDKDAFAAKVHAFTLGQRKDESFDVQVKGERMYTRPLLISTRTSLDEFVRSSAFSKESDAALDAAAHVMHGQQLEGAVQRTSLPVWSLDKWISDTSRIAYR